MEPTAEERAAWKAPFAEAELDMLGLRSVTDGGRLFCGVSQEQFAVNGVTYQWPSSIKVLRWGLNFSRLGKLSDMDFKDAATAWFAEISACCDLKFEYSPNSRLANILYTVMRLDGPMGVLADMQLPVGNVTPDTQLIGRFDDSENTVISENPAPGEIDIYRTGGHETLHALGLGHQPYNASIPALIAATYSRTIRNLQKPDKDELLRRYGPAVAVVPTTPAAPTPGSSPVNVSVDSNGNATIEQNGKVWQGRLNGLWKGQLQRAS